MKTLKESILSHSSHGAKEFEAQRREVIEDWLKERDIRNYTIKDDFTIDVKGDVDLSDNHLSEFPEYIQFRVVKGIFNCSSNRLTSLKGCPREVVGYFDCGDNELTSLEGAPVECHSFYCYNNYLTSLKGAPKEVRGYFTYNYNKLTSLEGCPKKVGGYFKCIGCGRKFSIDEVRVLCKGEGDYIG